MELNGKNKDSGFTLIELLVVISIIGLLASVVLVSLNSARAKGRNVKRLADMKQLQTALDLYYDKNNKYPGDTGSYGEAESSCGGWDSSTIDNNSDGKPFITPLLDGGIISKAPNDPLAISGSVCGGTHGYRYYRYGPDVAGGCDPCSGKFYYVLGFNTTEGEGVNPASPGWKCINPSTGAVTRDWQGEFSWVVGKCE